MTDVLPLSGGSVKWMQRLARQHEAGHGWVPARAAWPSDCFQPLIWMGLVEQSDIHFASFRLTDLGWWALGNVVENVDE